MPSLMRVIAKRPKGSFALFLMFWLLCWGNRVLMCAVAKSWDKCLQASRILTKSADELRIAMISAVSKFTAKLQKNLL